ncbi:NAD-P-binding protein [Heliocybe sulcata]|uniref:NAD-P-binding protein n=1 Tax=Heliocybe sulcata TaxID=5364 RepID=A0A5C3N6V7_9AGAM|nr:NAD-P-binding protein [Heliocybe sulcata]
MGLFSSEPSNSRGFDPSTDVPDLTGRVAIVTGANSGIGFFTVLHLARRGAKVYLGARSAEKAKAALARLHQEGLGPLHGEVVWLDLNLSDPRDARKAAEWFLEQESRLDILINNAGKIIGPYALTPDGISDSMVINHISPAAFTYKLLPLMKKTAELPEADVRIVNLTSMAHRWVSNPRFNSLASFNRDFSDSWFPKIMLYAYSKLANILWSKELQRRLDKEGMPIIVTAVHPGRVLSEHGMRRSSSWPMGAYYHSFMCTFNDTPFYGAYTSVFAAASPKLRANADLYKGKYLVPYGHVEEPSEDANRDDLARELWHTTDEILAKMS